MHVWIKKSLLHLFWYYSKVNSDSLKHCWMGFPVPRKVMKATWKNFVAQRCNWFIVFRVEWSRNTTIIMTKSPFIFFSSKKTLERKNPILFGKYWMGRVEIGVLDGNSLNSFNSLIHPCLLWWLLCSIKWFTIHMMVKILINREAG